jgi:hypothetical protein
VKFHFLFVLMMAFYIFANPAFAKLEDWELLSYREAGHNLRLKAKPEIYIEVQADPSGPKLLSAKNNDKHANIEMIDYVAGEFGTSEITEITRRVLFNTKTQKILGDFPLKYVIKGAKKKAKQPLWKNTTAGIEIYDPETQATDKVSAD